MSRVKNRPHVIYTVTRAFYGMLEALTQNEQHAVARRVGIDADYRPSIMYLDERWHEELGLPQVRITQPSAHMLGVPEPKEFVWFPELPDADWVVGTNLEARARLPRKVYVLAQNDDGQYWKEVTIVKQTDQTGWFCWNPNH